MSQTGSAQRGAAKPAVPGKSAPAPVRPHRRSRTVILAAGVAVIILAIGFPDNARRLGLPDWRATPVTEVQTPPVPAAEQARAVARTAPRSATANAEAARPRQSAQRPPASGAPGGARAAVTRIRQPNTTVQPARPVLAARPATEAPAAVAVPALPTPVAAVAPQTQPEPPLGRLFETSDVDERPQVASRVEPQLPADLGARPLNDVVVVRVLVSQTGHPFRVSLLRRSRSGAPLDEAVVAAVEQWTFVPARKRGAAVSCWFNIGVPLGAD
jgi:TonB family protein